MRFDWSREALYPSRYLLENGPDALHRVGKGAGQSIGEALYRLRDISSPLLEGDLAVSECGAIRRDIFKAVRFRSIAVFARPVSTTDRTQVSHRIDYIAWKGA